VGRSIVAALSPTDSCRDRLAAFYHWNDRQSLDTAVLIASRHRVNLAKIREWSADEGAIEGFEVFRRKLVLRRRRRQPRAKLKRPMARPRRGV
jgi:hypothetical protein